MRPLVRFGFPALLIVAVGFEISAIEVPASSREVDVVAGSSPSERYDEARHLMQGGRYSDAARTYRSVADSTEAPTPLRAQALFASALMEENARDYERALQVYGEVERRFPDTEGAARSHNKVIEFEEGGLARTIEFRRRWDAVWDELSPAQTLADQNDLRAARAGLERAAALLEAMLRDFNDFPKAKEVALTLGNTRMTLHRFGEAQADYRRAIALGERPPQPDFGSSTIDSFVTNAQERLAEAIRALRRQWATRLATGLLAAIGLVLLPLRPWRAGDVEMLRLASRLALATMLLGLFAAAGALFLKYFTDQNSPLEAASAALLVLLPGSAGQLVSLGFSGGLRTQLHWEDRHATGAAAVLGALAALAAAICVVNAFNLFPFLDSNF